MDRKWIEDIELIYRKDLDFEAALFYHAAFCGKLLGYGVSRYVFKFLPDTELVVKISLYEPAQNIAEYELFQDIKAIGHKNLKWLAPCQYLSQDGKILIQARTRKIPKNFKWPKRLPRFLADIKRSNFGLYKGRLVCHDYGKTLCSNYALSNKTRKNDLHN